MFGNNTEIYSMKIQGNLNLFTLIHRLHHQYKALSSSNSFSHYRFHAIAGVLGLSGLVLAIRDVKFGSLRGLLPSTDSSSSEELCFIAGLQNLGNNCFLNVILQSLLEEEDSCLVENGVERLPLTVALVSLFNELCVPHSERMTLSPRRVMLAMDHYIWHGRVRDIFHHRDWPQPSWDRTCTAAAAIGLLSELHLHPEFNSHELDKPAETLEDALEALLEALTSRRLRMGRSITRRERHSSDIC